MGSCFIFIKSCVTQFPATNFNKSGEVHNINYIDKVEHILKLSVPVRHISRINSLDTTYSAVQLDVEIGF